MNDSLHCVKTRIIQMKMLSIHIFINFFISLFSVAHVYPVQNSSLRSKVLLVSMDGFRWDYLQKVRAPNFSRLAGMGSHALYINNSFTTQTFPNHFTIVTGKYLKIIVFISFQYVLKD